MSTLSFDPFILTLEIALKLVLKIIYSRSLLSKQLLSWKEVKCTYIIFNTATLPPCISVFGESPFWVTHSFFRCVNSCNQVNVESCWSGALCSWGGCWAILFSAPLYIYLSFSVRGQSFHHIFKSAYESLDLLPSYLWKIL